MLEFARLDDIIKMINVSLKGKYECYITSPDTPKTVKPLFIRMNFKQHEQAWHAFEMLLESCKSPPHGDMFAIYWGNSSHYHKVKNMVHAGYDFGESAGEGGGSGKKKDKRLAQQGRP